MYVFYCEYFLRLRVQDGLKGSAKEEGCVRNHGPWLDS